MECLTAGDLVRVFETYRDALRDHQAELNALNVYPVPDGDTGTNMALTIEAVLEHLRKADRTMEAVTRAISQGSLLGARGNSGVILSQVLRGLMDTFREAGVVDTKALITAFARAATAAYEAVMRPVEGTILTVVRESAEAAATVPGGQTLATLLMRVHDEAARSLARTPELLPVLKAAGVVDAGARGFTLLLEAFLSVITGRAITPPTEVHAHMDARQEAPPGEKTIADLRYEVMFLLHAPDRDAVESFKREWMDIGDSIVVVGGDGLYNCHIHTDTIGPAIEAALDAGRPTDIRVTDLLDAVAERAEEGWVEGALGQPAGGVVTSPATQGAPELSDHIRDARTGVVAVVTGEGNSNLYWDLGVQAIVSGGQSMNPSTQDLLTAVEAIPAHDVIVLPNNKNIVPVAEQLDALTAKTVRVVPTRGISQGLAAMMAYSPLGEMDELARNMAAESARVVSGEVTTAVRDAQTEAGFAAAGSYLGVRDGKIVVVAATLGDALRELAAASVDDGAELLTLITGEDAEQAVTDEFVTWASAELGVEVEVTRGGQALYPYVFGVE